MTGGPPFRADHVGSLLRPKALREAFRAHHEGVLPEAGFKAVQDEIVRGAIALQEEAGLEAITDGEFRRPSYWARFVERVDGLEVGEALFRFRDADGIETGFTAPHVTAPVRRTASIAGDEYEFLAANTNRTPKVTLPSPPTMHFWRLGQGIEATAYETDGAFFADLAEVYRTEFADLAAAGATYVQLDEVPLAMLCDASVRERVAAAGEDADTLAAAYIDAFNQALAGRPPGLTVAVHLCRGNYRGQWLSEGGYDVVAERLFNDLDADALFLEYDTPRAGDFLPLRFVPAPRVVVLGLVSTKTPELEDTDAVARRIDEAAAVLSLDQLAVSPQCGFASTARGNALSEPDERAKLARVVEVAEKVWGGVRLRARSARMASSGGNGFTHCPAATRRDGKAAAHGQCNTRREGFELPASGPQGQESNEAPRHG
jgi:5-methyltetrahydropteroyltriglutamate--homocysteine methyltransferase